MRIAISRDGEVYFEDIRGKNIYLNTDGLFKRGGLTFEEMTARMEELPFTTKDLHQAIMDWHKKQGDTDG